MFCCIRFCVNFLDALFLFLIYVRNGFEIQCKNNILLFFVFVIMFSYNSLCFFGFQCRHNIFRGCGSVYV